MDPNQVYLGLVMEKSGKIYFKRKVFYNFAKSLQNEFFTWHEEKAQVASA